jgi:hypothetical protein
MSADQPICLGCGRQFKSTRQLLSHAVQCEHNRSIKLTSSVYQKTKKHKSDRCSKAKRPRIEDSNEVIHDGIEPVYNNTQADPPDNSDVLPLADVRISVMASSTIHINAAAGSCSLSVISHTFALLIRSSGCQIWSDLIHRSVPDLSR